MNRIILMISLCLLSFHLQGQSSKFAISGGGEINGGIFTTVGQPIAGEGQAGTGIAYVLIEDFYTSIEELEVKERIILFPNPASEEIQFVNEVTVNRYQIFTIEGRLIKQAKLKGQGLISIDVSTLSLGVYVLSLLDDDKEVVSRRFVKE